MLQLKYTLLERKLYLRRKRSIDSCNEELYSKHIHDFNSDQIHDFNSDQNLWLLLSCGVISGIAPPPLGFAVDPILIPS